MTGRHDTAKAFLSVVKTNPRQENGITFYDVCVLYAIPADGGLDWNILYRLADENYYVGDMDGGLRVKKFSNVLGQEGFKISVIVGTADRQQAYLALQELYNLTGLTVDSCYCAANEYGVVFSLLPDGFDQRSFYSMDFSERYGGGIPGLYIAWRESGNDWYPLSFAEAVQPDSWVGESELLRWYYERLDLFATGEAAYANLAFRPRI